MAWSGDPALIWKSPSTAQDEAPLRTRVRSARSPRRSFTAPSMMDFPAPVSPVMATKPEGGSHSRSSTSARLRMRRDASVADIRELCHPPAPFPSDGKSSNHISRHGHIARHSSDWLRVCCPSPWTRLPTFAPNACARTSGASMPSSTPIRMWTTFWDSMICVVFANSKTRRFPCTDRTRPSPASNAFFNTLSTVRLAIRTMSARIPSQ